MRIFFECSDTASNHIKTGIQRVVRNVIIRLGDVSKDLNVETKPVNIFADNFYSFNWHPASDPAEPAWSKFNRKYIYEQIGLSLGEKSASRIILCKLKIKKIFRFRKFKRFFRSWHYTYFREPLAPQASDLMVMLDASWGIHIDTAVKNWRKQGGKVAFVVYDLLPITHPQFFPAELVYRFSQWFDTAISNAELLLAISNTVRDQLREQVNLAFSGRAELPPRVESFRLGADLDMRHADGYVRPRLRMVLSGRSGPTPYLMVGTVEPRKNHRTVLEAFGQLWEQGSEVRLIIAGKVGWECRDLVRSIEEHPELHRRLFWFPDLTDTELHHCYKSTRCVVFASWGEGFGLPIIEGLQFGRPVIASDLPVHREVAGDHAGYFNPSSAEDLVSMILRLETEGSLPGTAPRPGFRATTWREGVTDLVNQCRKTLSEANATPD